jgi:hypothetical protein
MKQTNHSIAVSQLRTYLKANWGLPFIAAFICLLLASAISLSAGLSYEADAMAVFAFYSIAIGVVLQLICSFKYKKMFEAD